MNFSSTTNPLYVNGSDLKIIWIQLMYLLPAATKLWPRLCFYSCLWFCPQGGSPAGRTPQAGRSPHQEDPQQGTPLLWQGEPPWQGDPHGRETPLQGDPRQWGPTHDRETPPGRRPLAWRPPWQGGPPAGRPPQGEPPMAGRPHPPCRENPPWQGGPPPAGRTTPPLAYGQWAAGTHPTGMHSCFLTFTSNYFCHTSLFCNSAYFFWK